MLGLGFADISPGAGRTPNEEKETRADEASASLLSLLPWGVSILFHVGLVLIAIFVIWSTIRQPKEEDRVIPVVNPVFNDAPLDDLDDIDQPKPLPDPKPPRPRPSPGPVDNPSPIPDPAVGADGIPVPGDGFDTPSDKPGPFIDRFRDSQDGVKFIIQDSAKRIAYVIDASGSLLDSMPFVIENLKKSIGGLKSHQSFTVIFSQGDRAIEMPPKGLKRANEDHKRNALAWVDLDSGNVVPKGRSEPIVAIKAALRYKPEAIFLLSDNITGQGQFETDQKHLLSAVLKANTFKTRINTIQFLYPDPLVSIGLKPTLEVISSETGGKYKFIDGHELGIHW